MFRFPRLLKLPKALKRAMSKVNMMPLAFQAISPVFVVSLVFAELQNATIASKIELVLE